MADKEFQVRDITTPAFYPVKLVDNGDDTYSFNVSATVATITLPTAIHHGQKTVTTAGTEEALASSQALVSGVHIKALAANTGNVYVGANPVTSSTGYVLDAGEEVFLEVANLATVYIDVDTNGEGVSYVGS